MAKPNRPRSHNEWFQPSAKTTCECGMRHVPTFIWGEYANARWRRIRGFCGACFGRRVLADLVRHVNACGCSATVCARSGYTLPQWLRDVGTIHPSVSESASACAFGGEEARDA